MKNVSTKRLQEIAEEVINLIGAEDIFDFLSANETKDLQDLETRLREIMQSRQSFETIELAMYLRTSASRAHQLPTWQPLFNAALEQGIMKGEPVDDIFYGMMPPRAHPRKNTGNLT